MACGPGRVQTQACDFGVIMLISPKSFGRAALYSADRGEVMGNVWRVLLAFAVVMTMLFTPAAAQTATKRIVVLGDSLVAGFNLPADQAFPAVLQRELRARGHDIAVVNAGVSGDTSTGGLARLDWALADGADGVIVELGANDMLRGVDPVETEKALDSILAQLSRRKLPVLLAGMIAAPGMGKSFEERFNGIYGKLARKYDVLLYPFFLDGVTNERHMLLADGMHPNKQGVEEMVRRILPHVLKLIAQIQKQ